MKTFKRSMLTLVTLVGFSTSALALPLIETVSSPECGCCHLWTEYLEKNGIKTDLKRVDADKFWAFKALHKVKDEYSSCHTAIADGYVIEGHVPLREIERLLKEKPDAIGISVPGMPIGSPGMEVPNGTNEPYEVLLLRHDGTTEVYARYP